MGFAGGFQMQRVMTVPPAKHWNGAIGQHPTYCWDRRTWASAGYSKWWC